MDAMLRPETDPRNRIVGWCVSRVRIPSIRLFIPSSANSQFFYFFLLARAVALAIILLLFFYRFCRVHVPCGGSAVAWGAAWMGLV